MKSKPNLVVFLCGTYSDLQEERSHVIDALRRLHLQHESMEIFGARPEAPIDVCLAEVRQSDLLVVVLGHRYGTIVPDTELSFTETEYREGFRLGKPCFIYIRDESVKILPEQMERDPRNFERLNLFRQVVEFRHTVFHFNNSSELALQVTIDLNRSLASIDTVSSAMAIIRRGADAWNAWRTTNRGAEPSMDAADLRSLQLDSIDFSNMSLKGIDLRGTTLRGANLQGSELRNAELREVDMSFAQLDSVKLTQTNMKGARLVGTRLVGADLMQAVLIDAVFTDADLTRAVFGHTVIARCEFEGAKGLSQCIHNGPSSIDFDTLFKSPNIPDDFLRSAGLPASAIEYVHSLRAPVFNFYSCFISYSAHDQEFAERIYSDLRNKGIRCWFAPQDLRIGDKLRSSFDEAIRVYDKLMVLLSESSVRSPWVQREVETAFEKEHREKRTVLFPIRLDDAVMRTDQAWAADIRRTRHIGDFRDWKNHDSYKKAFERLLRDLKA